MAPAAWSRSSASRPESGPFARSPPPARWRSAPGASSRGTSKSCEGASTKPKSRGAADGFAAKEVALAARGDGAVHHRRVLDVARPARRSPAARAEGLDAALPEL